MTCLRSGSENDSENDDDDDDDGDDDDYDILCIYIILSPYYHIQTGCFCRQ